MSLIELREQELKIPTFSRKSINCFELYFSFIREICNYNGNLSELKSPYCKNPNFVQQTVNFLHYHSKKRFHSLTLDLFASENSHGRSGLLSGELRCCKKSNQQQKSDYILISKKENEELKHRSTRISKTHVV